MTYRTLRWLAPGIDPVGDYIAELARDARLAGRDPTCGEEVPRDRYAVALSELEEGAHRVTRMQFYGRGLPYGD